MDGNYLVLCRGRCESHSTESNASWRIRLLLRVAGSFHRFVFFSRSIFGEERWR